MIITIGSTSALQFNDINKQVECLRESNVQKKVDISHNKYIYKLRLICI